MVRTCHLDTCPVGIATQRPELRAKFAATPEMVEAFMRAVAQEVRELLACLGFRSLDDVIGARRLRSGPATVDAPAHLLDVESLLRRPLGERRSLATDAIVRPASVLGDRLFDTAWPAIRDGAHVELELPDRQRRSRRRGPTGRSDRQDVRHGCRRPGPSARVSTATAGQSFGAFLADGIELRADRGGQRLRRQGMGGGRIEIAAPPGRCRRSVARREHRAVRRDGRRAVHRRTDGRAVRACGTPGALAVVEGVGDHACEYMTGGRSSCSVRWDGTWRRDDRR